MCLLTSFLIFGTCRLHHDVIISQGFQNTLYFYISRDVILGHGIHLCKGWGWAEVFIFLSIREEMERVTRACYASTLGQERQSMPICGQGRAGRCVRGQSGCYTWQHWVLEFTIPLGDHGSPGILQRLLTRYTPEWSSTLGVMGAFGDKALPWIFYPLLSLLKPLNR